jgi:hypothetical protein
MLRTAKGAACGRDGEEDWGDASQNKKERSGIPLRSGSRNRKLVVVWTVVIVVVVVPIAVCVPSAIVFTPPTMAVFPAPFARDFQFRTLRFGLGTVPAMLCSGSVQIMVDANDSALTVFFVGARVRRTE